jgi:hypothetical protein
VAGQSGEGDSLFVDQGAHDSGAKAGDGVFVVMECRGREAAWFGSVAGEAVCDVDESDPCEAVGLRQCDDVTSRAQALGCAVGSLFYLGDRHQEPILGHR